MYKYIAIIHKDPESDYGVSFPDFPGCITAGITIDEAKKMAKQALKGHIQVMLEFDEKIPEPTPLKDIKAELQYQDCAALFAVEVSLINSIITEKIIQKNENRLAFA
ncbi:antitoxin HicB [Candidatus Magnetomoraceae bacterium gMMP-15]